MCSGSGEVKVKVNEQANVNVKAKVQDQGRHMFKMWLRLGLSGMHSLRLR